jgi:hypothetical protein
MKKKDTCKDSVEKSAEDSSSSSSDQQLILNDDPSSENVESSDDAKNTEVINIKVEHYYAVVYDNGWYIGRVININENQYTIKILKELDKFKWPNNDEIQVVPIQYIFYGHLELMVHFITKGRMLFFKLTKNSTAVCKYHF